MPLTVTSDISIHEAGHVILVYLMSDFLELYHVTIDEEFSKKNDIHSEGGVLYKYLTHPKNLQIPQLDQLCLFNLAGLAADLVNEHEGAVEQKYFGTHDFLSKIGHFHYQGDIIAYNHSFNRLIRSLQVSPQYYNAISIYFLTDFFSRKEVLPILLAIKDLIDQSKTVYAIELNNFLDQSYIGTYKTTTWPKVKDDRQNLF